MEQVNKKRLMADIPISEEEKKLIELVEGQRQPKNYDEAKLLQKIQEIQAKGGIVDIPFNQ